MKSDILIKEAHPNDAEQMIAYLKEVGAETDNLTFGEEGLPITAAEEAEYIQNVLDDPHSAIFLAWKDGRIVGDGSINGLPRRMSHRADLGLSVRKNEWNSGIGSALLQKLIDYAKDNKIEIINLEVRSDNLRAIHVYEKFGFKPPTLRNISTRGSKSEPLVV